ncbi:hypothetical protein SUGI_0624940 [Cryptomeria japonica]|uniref:BTB/POZ domain-containing protein FBL11 n=1 Tax=Cryptomeria japonica TaxID=3369 RepID=UPI0024147752|nr:BTB/POZ domain-containing protein FBL11 [Cryptomeria japonica]GLJ31186.1 hypothetical protein SUGI_0624940 [Cryptomeria japonica]
MASSLKNLVTENAEKSFNTDDDIVILEVRSPDVDLQVNNTDLQVPEIYAWKLQASDMPLSQTPEIIKIHVHRHRLMEHSTYFQSLFGGSFKESSSDYIVIQWDLPTFVALLQFIYGVALNLSFTNFVPLLEGALFFGVNNVIMECKNWSIQNLSSKKTKFSEVFLRQLIDVWNFGADNGIHFILELYTDFFAMNFAAVLQYNSFVALPYALLNACISHPLLTVDSERQLCEAILNWLASNKQCSEFNSHETLDNCFQILEKVRVGLLPLEFILGRLWRDYPSMVTALQASVMFDQISHNYSDIQFEDLELFRLRLTQYSEKLDLAGCQQVTGKILFFSSLRTGMVDTRSSSLVSSEALKRLVGTRQTFEGVRWPVLQQSHLVTSLSNLQEVNISHCWRFQEDDIIDWLQLLSPSVRIFKSKCCSQLKVSILDKLSQACPLIEEVDLSVDISPVAACKVSVLHVSCEAYPSHRSSANWVLLHKPISCNLTRLSLKGRTDIRDNDLMTIAALSHLISVLNIDGCTSLTDRGISCFLSSCTQLHSLHAALTSFGQHSITALLSISSNNDNPIMLEHDFSLSLHSSSSLVELDLGGCNDIDQAFLINYMACASSLSCLSLRHTNLGDEPLYAFKGNSLKELDICETSASIQRHKSFI